MKRREFVTGCAAVTSAARAARAVGDPARFQRLAAQVRGRVVLPADAAYEAARRVLSAKIDRRPAAIVRCADSDDVRRAIETARREALPIAVRSGGHALAGYGTCDGGVVIDMGGLRRAAMDAARRSVIVQGGAQSRDVDAVTGPQGLACVLGECPTVGFAGFATGGGEGYLMGLHGAGCDNIRAAKVALGDGRIVRAAPDEHPDLFWAIRGGGGNFGVITSLEVAAHPIGPVHAGVVRLQGNDLASGLKRLRDILAAAPDALTAITRIYARPKGGPAGNVRFCWSGAPGDADLHLAPILALGASKAGVLSYADFQAQGPTELDPVFDITRSGFIPTISDDLIDAIVHHSTATPVQGSISLSHLHGAVARRPRSDCAFPLRGEGFDVWVTAEWDRPQSEPAASDWVQGLWEVLGPRARGAYPNGLEDEGDARVAQAYGENYLRLRSVKRRYDPDNLFRFNANIAPL